MDVLTQRISLLLSETHASQYSDHSEADRWSLDDYDDDEDDDLLTRNFHFHETESRSVKRDSRKAQIVLGLIADGKKKVQEWSPLGDRGRDPGPAELVRTRSRSEERPLLTKASDEGPLLVNDPHDHHRNASIEFAKPVSFAAHRHSVSLVDIDTTGIVRNPSPVKQPAPLALTTHEASRLSTDRDLHSARLPPSRSGKRDSGSAFVNFSRPLSSSIASPNAGDRPSSMDKPSASVVTPAAPAFASSAATYTRTAQSVTSTPRPYAETAKKVVRDDIGLPRTPSHNTLALAQPIFQRQPPPNNFAIRRNSVADLDIHPYQRQKRPRSGSLWGSLPVCGLLSICPKPHVRLPDNDEDYTRVLSRRRTELGKSKLTEDNLRRWEDEIGFARRPIDQSALPRPMRPPMQQINASQSILPPPTLNKELPTPPTIWIPEAQADDQLPSPSSYSVPSPPPKDNWDPFYHHPNVPVELPKPICRVCNEAKPLNQFSVRQCTRRCTHAPTACRTCVEQWIEICIDDKGSENVVCPECNEHMDWEDVRFFANLATFERYDELITRSALYKIDAFFWCLSPQCSSGQIQPFPLTDHPTFVCTACAHVYCINHPSPPYHAGLSCPEFEALLNSPTPAIAIANWMQQVDLDKALEEQRNLQRARLNREQERKGEATVQEVGKRCPNALCGWWIEKSEGCDRMVCLKCRFEFCWECGAPWSVIEKKGHLFHRFACKYWG